jgi:hypothetical protein
MKTRLENSAEALELAVLETLNFAKKSKNFSPREREALFSVVTGAIARLRSAQMLLQDSGDDCVG